jgi:hypothetical protein
MSDSKCDAIRSSLRNAFAGIVSRHDQSYSRIVVTEYGYGQFMEGPLDADWQAKHVVFRTDLALREPNARFVSPEEKKQILRERSDAQFHANSVGEELYYVQPGTFAFSWRFAKYCRV